VAFTRGSYRCPTGQHVGSGHSSRSPATSTPSSLCSHSQTVHIQRGHEHTRIHTGNPSILCRPTSSEPKRTGAVYEQHQPRAARRRAPHARPARDSPYARPTHAALPRKFNCQLISLTTNLSQTVHMQRGHEHTRTGN